MCSFLSSGLRNFSFQYCCLLIHHYHRLIPCFTPLQRPSQLLAANAPSRGADGRRRNQWLPMTLLITPSQPSPTLSLPRRSRTSLSCLRLKAWARQGDVVSKAGRCCEQGRGCCGQGRGGCWHVCFFGSLNKVGSKWGGDSPQLGHGQCSSECELRDFLHFREFATLHCHPPPPLCVVSQQSGFFFFFFFFFSHKFPFFFPPSPLISQVEAIQAFAGQGALPINTPKTTKVHYPKSEKKSILIVEN